MSLSLTHLSLIRRRPFCWVKVFPVLSVSASLPSPFDFPVSPQLSLLTYPLANLALPTHLQTQLYPSPKNRPTQDSTIQKFLYPEATTHTVLMTEFLHIRFQVLHVFSLQIWVFSLYANFQASTCQVHQSNPSVEALPFPGPSLHYCSQDDYEKTPQIFSQVPSITCSWMPAFRIVFHLVSPVVNHLPRIQADYLSFEYW